MLFYWLRLKIHRHFDFCLYRTVMSYAYVCCVCFCVASSRTARLSSFAADDDDDFRPNRATCEITLNSIRPKHTTSNSKLIIYFQEISRHSISLSKCLWQSKCIKKKVVYCATANKLISWMCPSYIWWTCFGMERALLCQVKNEKLRGVTLSRWRCEKLLEMTKHSGKKK